MATANELRQMTGEELARMAGDMRQSLFDMRLKHRTGHLENTAELSKSRRELARLETLIHEGKLGLARKVKTPEPAGARGAKAAPAKKAKAPKSGEKTEKAVKAKRSAKV